MSNAPMDMAQRVFSESRWKPDKYLFGFVEDVAGAIHAGKLDGIGQEKARIVSLLEAEAAEWSRSSEAFHAAGDFDAEEAAQACATILHGTVLKIKAAP